MVEKRALVTIIEHESAGASYSLPDPTTYSAVTSMMLDGGRSVSGHLLSSTVREEVVQISLTWNYLEASIWSEINKLFKHRNINAVVYYDQTNDDWERRELQVSERNAGLWRRGEDGEVLGWTGCSLVLTEV